MLDHKCNDAAVNQCFSTEQSRFASTRIVRRSPYEIKGSCNTTRAVAGTGVADSMAHVQTRAVIIERIRRASVSSNECSRGKAERREPLLTQLDVRIRDVRQGADGLLYVATEKRSAGDDADGTILRIEPAD